jgi:hypothetical protein
MAHPAFAYFGVLNGCTTGDAVPGPLAFCAFRQKHERPVVLPDAAVNRRGRPPCLPNRAVTSRSCVAASCYWPKAKNAGGVGAEPPKGRRPLRSRRVEACKNRMSRDYQTTGNPSTGSGGRCAWYVFSHPGWHGQTRLPVGSRVIRPDRISTIKQVWRCHPAEQQVCWDRFW